MTATIDAVRTTRGDRVVVHVPGVLGRIARLHHQRGERVRPDDGHADAEDHQADRGAGDGRQRDARRDAAADHRPGGPVADAPDRLHVARRVGIVVELVAQPADVDVDRAIEDVGRLVAVDRVEELVARQDAAVGGEDRREQLELDPGQVDRGVASTDLVARPRRSSGRHDAAPATTAPAGRP